MVVWPFVFLFIHVAKGALAVTSPKQYSSAVYENTQPCIYDTVMHLNVAQFVCKKKKENFFQADQFRFSLELRGAHLLTI